MLKLGGVETDITKGRELLEKVIENGEALNKLKELVINQGGDARLIEDKNLFTIAPISYQVKAIEEGYIYELDAEKVGIASLIAGAGRETKDDDIDYGAGIILKKKMGDYVHKGDVIATIFTSNNNKLNESENMLLEAYIIKDEKPNVDDIIYKIIE